MSSTFGTTESECRGRRTARFDAAPMRATSGAQEFSEEQGAHCLQRLQTEPCSEFAAFLVNGTLPSECDVVFEGRLWLDSPCVFSADCAPGTYCAGPLDAQVCRPRLPIGAPCFGDASDGCIAGSHCDLEAPMPTCVVRLPDGAACTTRSSCVSLRCDGTCQSVATFCTGR